MVQKIKSIAPFLIGYVCFACLLIFVIVAHQQGDWVLYMSENRTPFLNNLFKIWTLFGEEIFYIVAMLLAFYKSIRDGLVAALSAPLVMVIVFLLKTYLAHPRPRIYLDTIGRLSEFQAIEGVHFLGGSMSFPSGHTAAGFAICTFLALTFTKLPYQIFFLVLAIGVGISRIYLGQHFPKDVLFGSFLGIAIVFLAYGLLRNLLKNPIYNESVFSLIKRKNRV